MSNLTYNGASTPVHFWKLLHIMETIVTGGQSEAVIAGKPVVCQYQCLYAALSPQFPIESVRNVSGGNVLFGPDSERDGWLNVESVYLESPWSIRCPHFWHSRCTSRRPSRTPIQPRTLQVAQEKVLSNTVKLPLPPPFNSHHRDSEE